jgi:hypothetical protein
MRLIPEHKRNCQGWHPSLSRLIASRRRHLAHLSSVAMHAVWQRAASLAILIVAVLARDSVRHGLGMALANCCIVGGVIAAPIVSLLGWIGMVLPPRTPLHAAAPILFTASMVWLCLAIVGAHAESTHRQREDS